MNAPDNLRPRAFRASSAHRLSRAGSKSSARAHLMMASATARGTVPSAPIQKWPYSSVPPFIVACDKCLRLSGSGNFLNRLLQSKIGKTASPLRAPNHGQVKDGPMFQTSNPPPHCVLIDPVRYPTRSAKLLAELVFSGSLRRWRDAGGGRLAEERKLSVYDLSKR